MSSHTAINEHLFNMTYAKRQKIKLPRLYLLLKGKEYMENLN